MDNAYFKVLRGHGWQDDLLSDYCDGLVYKSHPLFVESPNALQIYVYYDDCEICNPLGSRAKTHKLGIFNSHTALHSTNTDFYLLQ